LQIMTVRKIILFDELLAFRLLRRGQILLIAGGAAVAVSLSVLGYYGMRLVETLEEKYSVEPGKSIEISQNLTSAGQGAYIVAFQELSEAKPIVTIRGPADTLVLQNSVDQLIVLQAFPVAEDGVYSLNLSNPNTRSTLEAAVVMDSQEAVLSRAGALSTVITVAFGFMLVAGVGALVAGTVIAIMDKRRVSKMKQFGDTSDLV
jgi:hypothetical protein